MTLARAFKMSFDARSPARLRSQEMDARDRRLEILKLTYSHHLGVEESILRAQRLIAFVEGIGPEPDKIENPPRKK